MKKILALLMAITLIFSFFVVAEAEGAYTYSSDWLIEIGSKNGGMWAISPAFDGKNDTYWHSWYKAEGATIVEKDQCPHSITVTFPEALEIGTVSYTPRQDSNATGTWQKAEIYGSTDGVNFIKLVDETYDVVNTRAEAKTAIPKNNYKAIRFVTTEALSGFSTIAELRFYKEVNASQNTPSKEMVKTETSKGWKVEASSSDGSGAGLKKAFDGNENTYWHSDYTVVDGKITFHEECPHEIIVTFPEPTEYVAVTYLPRKDNATGIWRKAEIYGSTDGVNFTKLVDEVYNVVATRALTTTEIPKAKYKAIKIIVTEAEAGYATAAEINFINIVKEVKKAENGKIVLEANKADGLSSVTKTEDGVTAMDAGDYFKIEGVDLTGMKSVAFEGDSLIPSVENGDAYQIRIDDPDKGDCLGYVLFNKKELLNATFSANIKETEGVHDLYIKSTYGQFSENVIRKIIFSSETVDEGNTTVVPDSAIVDNYADTWVATDALGRKLADYEEAGPVKEGLHEISMFYWNWAPNNTGNARIPSEIVAKNPEAKDDYYHEAWDTKGRYFWGEPLFGYYTSYDYFAYRRHAEMLANAGVDSIFLDMSNATWAFVPTSILIFEAFADAKEAGVNIPEIYTWSTNTDKGFRALYHNIISNPRFRDIWYEWEGKMLIFGGNPKNAYEKALKEADTETIRVLKDILDNTTHRGNASRAEGDVATGGWQWLQNYPQTKWKTSVDAERTEAMTLGTGINHSYVFGYEKTGVFSDPYVKGRSYTEAFGEDYRPEAKNQGYFFKEQASRVLEEDPMIVIIDGWNEWTAGRNAEYSGFTNAFVDTYDEENSRDFEPSRGALRDDYYMLLVDFVRKYKGVRPAPLATAETVIDLAAGDEQWTNVGPEFLNVVEGYERDHLGSINPETGEHFHYTTKISNLIKSAKVARNAENLYFTAVCEKAIVKNDSFMHLYIDIDRNRATGWEGYDFSYNVLSVGTLAKYENGAWVAVEGSAESITGNRITVSIPKAVLGETEKVDLEFKWADNVAENGDLLLFYEHGSVAPNGRFNYLYTEIEQKSLDKNTRENLYDTTVLKENHNRMNVNGGEMYVYEADTRVTTVMDNGMLYIPVIAAEEILGYGETKYEFYPEKNMLHLSSHGLENFEITDYVWSYTVLGTNEVRINGKAATLTNPVKVINGICYIPLSYFSDVFGWEVKNANGIWTVAHFGAYDSAVAKAAELL